MGILKQFKEVVEKLQKTQKRTEKEEILHQIKDNDAIKDIFYFIYNPYILTGISKKKINKKITKIINFNLHEKEELQDIFKYLYINNTGKDDDILKVQYFIKNNEEYSDLLTSIFTKDLKIGITSTTLNKVFGDYFIPTFDVMLANKYFDNPSKYLPDGEFFILTEKLDGVRCILINEDKPQFFTRQGQLIEGLNELKNEAKKLPKGMVFDGELLLNSGFTDNQERYKLTVSEINSNKENKSNLTFHCFDALPIEDFKMGKCLINALERKKCVHSIFENSNTPHFLEVPMLYYGTDKMKIMTIQEKVVKNGGEGLMINIADAPYECKRSNFLLKVKTFNTADVKIVKVNEGTGSFEGILGSFTVEFIAPDGNIYQCDIGSGLTYIHRKHYWNQRNELIGRIMEVKYFEISKNKDGIYSLRFPVFKCLRNDKDEISMY